MPLNRKPLSSIVSQQNMKEEIIKKAQDLWGDEKQKEAIALLRPLAMDGHIVAKSNLGLFLVHYFENNELPYIDEGVKLLQEACEAGEPSACHNLGTLWMDTIPLIGHDRKKAALYFLKARDLGGNTVNDSFYEIWEKELSG